MRVIHRRHRAAAPVRERHISFNSLMGAMVHNGVKTETRRPLNFNPPPSFPYPRNLKKNPWRWAFHEKKKGGAQVPEKGLSCPYGVKGQLLWIREPYWVKDNPAGQMLGDFYGYHGDLMSGQTIPGGRLMKPSDMPRLFCRTTLQVQEIQVEPLQSINDAGATAEGFTGGPGHFKEQWDKIYRKEEQSCWEVNPWVWVIRFQVLTANPFRVY